MFTNNAAWLTKKYGKLEVKPAPYTSPKDDEIVIKNHAVAINPVDWAKSYMGDFMFPWILNIHSFLVGMSQEKLWRLEKI